MSSDNGKEVTVTAELPGMSDADVDVSISDGQLTIRGEKKSDREAEENGVLVRERIYGAMERTVPLPDGVDPDAAKATFTNGVLTIVIPEVCGTAGRYKAHSCPGGLTSPSPRQPASLSATPPGCGLFSFPHGGCRCLRPDQN